MCLVGVTGRWKGGRAVGARVDVPMPWYIVWGGGWTLACQYSRQNRWVDASVSMQTSESMGGRKRVGAVVGVGGSTGGRSHVPKCCRGRWAGGKER